MSSEKRYVCEGCGKEYKYQRAWVRHTETCYAPTKAETARFEAWHHELKGIMNLVVERVGELGKDICLVKKQVRTLREDVGQFETRRVERRRRIWKEEVDRRKAKREERQEQRDARERIEGRQGMRRQKNHPRPVMDIISFNESEFAAALRAKQKEYRKAGLELGSRRRKR